MEIKYTRTYAPKGKKYTLGEMPLALGYAMEIIEPRPKLAEGKLNPGELCMLLFALTPEEYALKDDDSKALDRLADQLSQKQPADRLLAWLVRDLKGAPVQSAVKPKMGESIDGGDLARRVREKQAHLSAGPADQQLLECKRLQLLCAKKDAPEGVKADWQAAKAALGRILCELDTIYAAYDALLGERWPAVGFDGRVEIFTAKQRAENVARQILKANADVNFWTLKEITGADIEIFFKKLEFDGLTELRVDNGFASVELSLRDFRQLRPEENAGLRSMMVREITYGMRWNAFKQANAPEKNKIGALESMLSFKNFVHHTLGKAVLYAACDVPDGHDRLCTIEASERLADKEGYRIVAGERCVVIKSSQLKQDLLAVFTTPVQAVAFCERMGSAARPVAMIFDELTQRAAPCDGMIIDPDSCAYRLIKSDYDKVRELREKPLTIVRVRPPEESAAPVKATPNSEVAALPNPDAGTLPNPDAGTLPNPDAVGLLNHGSASLPNPDEGNISSAKKAFDNASASCPLADSSADAARENGASAAAMASVDCALDDSESVDSSEDKGDGAKPPRKGFFRRLFGK